MRSVCWFLVVCFGLAFFLNSCNSRSGPARVLVFSKTAGFRHSSIPQAKEAIMRLGKENGFLVDTTENAAYFTEDSLQNYSAVLFLNTTGDVLDHYQEADFERYIQAGGGYVGVHAASDTEYDWGWYGRLVGGYFASHPHIQEAKLRVLDKSHPATEFLPQEWVRSDEWYNFKKLNPEVRVLIDIDESSYEGGANEGNHPMSWYHEYDGGRSFFTALGHTEESYQEENFLKHLLGGIQYAIGKNQKLRFNKASTQRVPEPERFTKITLAKGEFFEPTEMAILPNLDILVAQRRGELMLFKSSDSSVKQVGLLNVYHKTSVPDVNAEEGFMGFQIDPDFKTNGFVYAFYSPYDTSVNRLSRFDFRNDSLIMASEKIILEFYSQREICCHTGGSISFGEDRILYLSTGDNATPFDEPGQAFVNRGFAPLDDRPGHEQYDARRTSSNTNDLRGKVLRIRINTDGSYEIPDGNLYPQQSDSTRPEIYVMGNRNPYRISVDKKTGYLYWGDVGPDAANDSLDTRGPRGYDELNQAREAGYFGWPLFVGANYPYRNYDYQRGVSGEPFNPKAPLNFSRNNSGKRLLPPVSPPFIWYPYANSPDFPQLGNGGRNAMAGPVYYPEDFPKESRLPDYFRGKLFFYDWIRGWIKLVTMRPNGDFDKMDPFMASTSFAAPIDMETGPDGRIYILEYGKGWFSKNPDAAISVISYNGGNIPPVIEAFHVDRSEGAVPMAVSVTVKARDPDNGKLSYRFDMGDGTIEETSLPAYTHTYSKEGQFRVLVTVSDEGTSVRSESKTIYAGNQRPQISINIAGNRQFYFPGRPVQYEVTVRDPDEPAAVVDSENLVVTASYQQGTDLAGASQGHQVLTDAMIGKNLMEASDCRTCHQIDKKSIGPSFKDIGRKYGDDPQTIAYLSDKILKGSVGVWGETAMAAHPDMPEDEARKIVLYIKSISAEKTAAPSLPVAGKLDPTLGQPAAANGRLVISASYTDKGRGKVGPLTGSVSYTLVPPIITIYSAREKENLEEVEQKNRKSLRATANQSSFVLDSLDLLTISALSLEMESDSIIAAGLKISVYLDGEQGTLLGEWVSAVPWKPGNSRTQVVAIKPVSKQEMYRVFVKISNGQNIRIYGLSLVSGG